jgi:molecular chaperone HscB
MFSKMFLRLFRTHKRFACCGSKSPPNITGTHFQVFRIPEEYNVDLALLEKRYKHQQKLYHPDISKKPNALEISTHMNVAYTTLKNPLERAKYVLRLLGQDPEDVHIRLDEAFLERCLEMREGEVDITELKKEHEDLVKKIGECIDNEDYIEAIKCTKKLVYIDKAIRES